MPRRCCTFNIRMLFHIQVYMRPFCKRRRHQMCTRIRQTDIEP